MVQKREISQTEILFHTNRKEFRKIFNQDTEKSFSQYIKLRQFFDDIWLPFVKEAKPPLIQLAFRQSPLLDKTTVPVIINYINVATDNHCSRLIVTFSKVSREHRQKVDLQKKYPRLEQWRQFYCNPKKPTLLTDKQRNPWQFTNDKDWKKYKAEENRKIQEIHHSKEHHFKQYSDIVQPLLFKHLPHLADIEKDHWVIFAVTLRDFYEEWKAINEKAEDTIQYEMPPESLHWKYEKWSNLFSKHFRQKQHTQPG